MIHWVLAVISPIMNKAGEQLKNYFFPEPPAAPSTTYVRQRLPATPPKEKPSLFDVINPKPSNEDPFKGII